MSKPWMVVVLVVSAMLCGCESDNARSTTGPGINIHCDAAVPQDTTVKVVCPAP